MHSNHITMLIQNAIRYNIYSYQKHESENRIVNATSNEIEQYIGILLKMAILKKRQYRMYWSAATRVPCIADVMSQKRFDHIKSHIHFNDNTSMPTREMNGYDRLH